MRESPQPTSILLSTQIASRSQRRTALVVSLLLLATCISVWPFAGTTSHPSLGFAIAQQVVLALNDLITAALLLGQYSFERVRGFTVLAAGYLFTALMSIPWLLSFPGIFAEGGFLVPASTTPWLFTAWYAALPLAIIVYGSAPARIDLNRSSRADILRTIVVFIIAAPIVTMIIVLMREWLPVLVTVEGYYTAAQRVVCGVLIGLVLVALLVLVRRRPYSVLDLWLMVGTLAWMFSLILVAIISSRRFDIPAYAGRLLGVLASTFVLIVLLSEMNVLYGRVVHATISERQERERRLREMEAVLFHLSRVNELGQNASSLIHEINQPLAAISYELSAGIRLSETSDPKRSKAILEHAAEQVTRAMELIRGLRDFIAKRDSDKQNNSVSDMLHEAVKFALVGVTADALSVEIVCSPNASIAYFDRVQIEQVVVNLVRNSIEAMTGTTRRIITITATSTADDMVEIAVADTGLGLATEIREKLFEPFVTSKQSGLGVGLSICRVIIEAHGGQLTASDNPGGGTIFRFTLPQPQIADLKEQAWA